MPDGGSQMRLTGVSEWVGLELFPQLLSPIKALHVKLFFLVDVRKQIQNPK